MVLDTTQFEQTAKNLMYKSKEIMELIEHHEEVVSITEDIKYLREYAGQKIFTGRSGKLDEPNLLGEIEINKIGGCLAVPELLLKLAEEELKATESALHTLTKNTGE